MLGQGWYRARFFLCFCSVPAIGIFLKCWSGANKSSIYYIRACAIFFQKCQTWCQKNIQPHITNFDTRSCNLQYCLLILNYRICRRSSEEEKNTEDWHNSSFALRQAKLLKRPFPNLEMTCNKKANFWVIPKYF